METGRQRKATKVKRQTEVIKQGLRKAAKKGRTVTMSEKVLGKGIKVNINVHCYMALLSICIYAIPENEKNQEFDLTSPT